MSEVKNLLKAREKQLLQLKKEKEKALRSVPEGFLRINRHKNKTEFYHRTDPKDKNGTYIKEKDIRLFHKLRNGIIGNTMNLPGKSGRKISIAAYRIAQKVVGFN